MSLSDRIRPDVEAAPWVVEEVRKLEAEVALLKNHYSLDAASKLRAEVAAARSLTALREHERDEARAEVERLRADLNVVDDDLTLAAKRWEAEAMRAHNLARTVAERQREADIDVCRPEYPDCVARLKATPLVTEGDK